MRTKDIDSVLPRINVELTEDDELIVDGASTKLINGAITQNGLELIERMDQVHKDLGERLKEVKDRVIDALCEGTKVQAGNRRAKVTKSTRNNVKYKDLAADVLELDPKRDEEEWKKAIEAYSTTSTSHSLKID